MALLANGSVRDARGLTSSTNTSPSATASWTLTTPTTPRARASRRRPRSPCGSPARSPAQGDAGRIAGVHACLLDVLHDLGDPGVCVGDNVDVDLDSALEEAGRRACARPRVPRCTRPARCSRRPCSCRRARTKAGPGRGIRPALRPERPRRRRRPSPTPARGCRARREARRSARGPRRGRRHRTASRGIGQPAASSARELSGVCHRTG